MKIVGYYVTKGGQPTAFKNISGSYRGGLLVPVKEAPTKSPLKDTVVAFFSKRRDARRAMNRSKAAAQALPGSLVEDWARKNVPSYFDGKPFEIQPLAKQ